jgi:hypothetical protein
MTLWGPVRPVRRRAVGTARGDRSGGLAVHTGPLGREQEMNPRGSVARAAGMPGV